MCKHTSGIWQGLLAVLYFLSVPTDDPWKCCPWGVDLAMRVRVAVI